jgi:hypothetical protein
VSFIAVAVNAGTERSLSAAALRLGAKCAMNKIDLS